MSSQTTPERAVRILLVEDDNHIGRILELAMPTLGFPYEFVYAISAEEGLEHWRVRPFDLVLSDYNLRGMNGLKFIATLKDQGATVPTILVTAYESSQITREAQDLGVTAYIAKPFFIDEMIEKIRALLPIGTRAVNGKGPA